VLRGNALAQLKDFDAAVTEYQDAIALDPTRNSAYTNLGYVQLAQGKRGEAEATFKAAINAAPKSVPGRLALANFYWSTGQLPQAEETLKATLDLDASELTANRVLGLFYLSTNRVAEAEKYFIALARIAKTDQAKFALADYYTVAGRNDEARKILQERARDDAAYAAASVRLASLDARDGQRAAAQDRLHQVLQKHAKDSTALLLSARLSLADNKRADARKSAEAVIANEPDSAAAANAWQIIGTIDAATDRHEDAIRAFEQVLKRQPGNPAANLALARLHLVRGDVAKAATYAQAVSALQPGQPDATNVIVRADIVKGDIAAATADLAPLQKAFPNGVGVAKLNALVAMASKKPEAARAGFEQVLKTSPHDLEALEGIVAIDVAAGRGKTAVARVDDELKRAAPDARLLVLAARAHAALGDLETAETLLLKAVDIDPDQLQPYNLLAALYTRQDRLEEAKQRLHDVLTRNPKSVGAATMIGMLLELQGRQAEGETQYLAVLGIDPRAPVASNNLAWLYVTANKKLDDALQLARVAQQMLPDQANVNDTIGWIYYRKNMPEQAVGYLESATQKQPQEPLHHFHLGMAYVKAGDWTKAKVELNRAFTLKADFDGAPEARKALTMIGG
jgi:tetratricopeptide (TPR) repeat protein